MTTIFAMTETRDGYTRTLDAAAARRRAAAGWPKSRLRRGAVAEAKEILAFARRLREYNGCRFTAAFGHNGNEWRACA